MNDLSKKNISTLDIMKLKGRNEESRKKTVMEHELSKYKLISECAAYLGISHLTLLRLIKAERIQSVYIGKTHVIQVAELLRFEKVYRKNSPHDYSIEEVHTPTDEELLAEYIREQEQNLSQIKEMLNLNRSAS